jgi:arylsulfatase A-like enzyme
VFHWIKKTAPPLLLTSLLLAGCGESDQVFLDNITTASSPLGLIRLDPRLEDGRSPAEALIKANKVISVHRFGSKNEETSPWRVEGAKVYPTTDNVGLMVGNERKGGKPKGSVRLVHDAPIAASEVNRIELLLRKKTVGTAVLSWQIEGDPNERIHTLSVMVVGSEKPQTIRFDLAKSPYWVRNLRNVVIEPAWNESAYFRLGEVRLMLDGFKPYESRLGGDSGDGGLYLRGKIYRRIWPSDLGIPLYARCRVPKDARFFAFAAVSPITGAKPIRIILDARTKGKDWRRLHDAEIICTEPWHPLNADLSDYAGRIVELRFTALGREGVMSESPLLDRALVYWAEPHVSGAPTAEKPPNVLLITLDTTRADHVGDPGYTPCLARLGAEGIVFENAWSNCNSTTPSHASILTGRYLFEHGTLSNSTVLAEENLTLAEQFRKAGHATAGAVSAGHINTVYGFGQGMDRFNLVEKYNTTDGLLTVQTVLPWIEEWNRNRIEPFFLWLHLFDPHIPYQPPPGYVESFADRLGIEPPPPQTEVRTVPVLDKEYEGHQNWLGEISNRDHVNFLYQAGVGYADHLVELVVDALEEKGFYDDTWIVVTADHGECLGEHDVWYEHQGLFNESLRVPLIVKVPGGPAGIRKTHPVSTLDIAPTLMKHLGLGSPEGLPGRDLLADAPGGAGDAKRRLWFEYMNHLQIATRDSRYHFITTLRDLPEFGLAPDHDGKLPRFGKGELVEKGSSFLFNIQDDSLLEHDLSEEDPKLVENYLKMLQEWKQRLRKGKTIERCLTEEELERLEQLGYAGN